MSIVNPNDVTTPVKADTKTGHPEVNTPDPKLVKPTSDGKGKGKSTTTTSPTIPPAKGVPTGKPTTPISHRKKGRGGRSNDQGGSYGRNQGKDDPGKKASETKTTPSSTEAKKEKAPIFRGDAKTFEGMAPFRSAVMNKQKKKHIVIAPISVHVPTATLEKIATDQGFWTKKINDGNPHAIGACLRTITIYQMMARLKVTDVDLFCPFDRGRVVNVTRLLNIRRDALQLPPVKVHDPYPPLSPHDLHRGSVDLSHQAVPLCDHLLLNDTYYAGSEDGDKKKSVTLTPLTLTKMMLSNLKADHNGLRHGTIIAIPFEGPGGHAGEQVWHRDTKTGLIIARADNNIAYAHPEVNWLWDQADYKFGSHSLSVKHYRTVVSHQNDIGKVVFSLVLYPISVFPMPNGIIASRPDPMLITKVVKPRQISILSITPAVTYTHVHARAYSELTLSYQTRTLTSDNYSGAAAVVRKVLGKEYGVQRILALNPKLYARILHDTTHALIFYGKKSLARELNAAISTITPSAEKIKQLFNKHVGDAYEPTVLHNILAYGGLWLMSLFFVALWTHTVSGGHVIEPMCPLNITSLVKGVMQGSMLDSGGRSFSIATCVRWRFGLQDIPPIYAPVHWHLNYWCVLIYVFVSGWLARRLNYGNLFMLVPHFRGAVNGSPIFVAASMIAIMTYIEHNVSTSYIGLAFMGIAHVANAKDVTGLFFLLNLIPIEFHIGWNLGIMLLYRYRAIGYTPAWSNFVIAYETDVKRAFDYWESGPIRFGESLKSTNAHPDYFSGAEYKQHSQSPKGYWPEFRFRGESVPLETILTPEPKPAIWPFLLTNGVLRAPTPGNHSLVAAIHSRDSKHTVLNDTKGSVGPHDFEYSTRNDLWGSVANELIWGLQHTASDEDYDRSFAPAPGLDTHLEKVDVMEWASHYKKSRKRKIAEAYCQAVSDQDTVPAGVGRIMADYSASLIGAEMKEKIRCRGYDAQRAFPYLHNEPLRMYVHRPGVERKLDLSRQRWEFIGLADSKRWVRENKENPDYYRTGGKSLKLSMFAKSDETLFPRRMGGIIGTKPRPIKALPIAYQYVLQPWIRAADKAFKNLLKNEFYSSNWHDWDDTLRVTGKDLRGRFTSASGLTGTAITTWRNEAYEYVTNLARAYQNEEPLTAPTIFSAIFLGDDLYMIVWNHYKFPGVLMFFESDYSHFDQSQGDGAIMAEIKVWAAMGVPDHILGLLYNMAVAPVEHKKHRGGKNDISVVLPARDKDLGAMRITGGPNTGPGNGVTNVNIAFAALSVQNPNKLYERLGVTVKEKWSEVPGKATFLRGRFHEDLAGRRVWGWLPSAVIKLGKISRPFKNPAEMKRVAYGTARGLGNLPSDFPVLGAFRDTLLRLGTKCSDSVPWEAYRPCGDIVNVNREEVLRWMFSHYGLSRRQVEGMEHELRIVQSLPWLASHSGFGTLAMADYG